MDNSSRPSFTNMMNSALASSNQQNTNNQQHGLQLSVSMNFPPYQLGPNFQTPLYPQSFHSFGGHPSFQQLPSSGYQQGIPFHGNFHGADMTGGPSSPVASASLFGVGGGNGSRCEGSASPVSSPIPPVENTNKDPIWSDAGSDEKNKGGRMYWSEKDNLRLLSAWINNSNDPIDGNSKSGARYWNEVAAEYNNYAPKDRKRTATQCKNHYNTINALVTRFHGCWTEISNTYESGRSDEQIMEKVHAEYKRVKETNKPFPFEYWWKVVKDEPKWLNRDVAADIRNKRTKVSASGAYTSSSNRDTDEATERRRPQGQKAAKEQRKGKGKVGKTWLSDENVAHFNGLQVEKKAAIDNMAAAAREHAQALAQHAATEKEKVKVEKIKEYKELLMIDTSSYSEEQKASLKKMLDFLSDDIYGRGT